MKRDTTLIAAGRHPEDQFGAVNTPIYQASTITRPTLADWEASRDERYQKGKYVYGRFGTPTTGALEEAVAALEGADRAVAVSSGMAACAAAILACVKGGDHILVPDAVYFPVRNFCNAFLAPFGVETTFYDPTIGKGIASLLRDNTRLIYLEAPGSQTFEMQDVPAITAIARERGIYTAFDNTWGTPLLFRPLEHGVDFSINAATKYFVGHSDAMLGVVSVREELFKPLKDAAMFTGNGPGAHEAYLGLRGLRTMGVRLERHGRNTLRVTRWFAQQKGVHKVLYPALPDDPGHAIWRRDFDGASGLFSVMFEPFEKKAVAAFVDDLEHFLIGASFGGYESLVLPFDPSKNRTATEWRAPGPCLRFHIGLEDPDDLIADLDKGLARMRAA